MTLEQFKQIIMDKWSLDFDQNDIETLNFFLNDRLIAEVKHTVFLEDYCDKAIMFVLYLIALDSVVLYTEERKVFNVPLHSFLVVSDKLKQAQALVLLLESTFEKIYRNICLLDADENILRQQLNSLATAFKFQLIPNLDNLLCLMGARGFMMTSPVAKVWELLHERLFQI